MSDYIKPEDVDKLYKDKKSFNDLCRENKDILDRGAFVGIFLCLLLVVYMVSNIMVREQVKWVSEVCPCYYWGGNAFSLEYQEKTTNSSLMGVSYGGPTG